jgi:hypothetical protein
LSFSTQVRFKRRDDIIFQQTSGATVLFDLDDGRYLSLNEVGARVWELCDGTRNAADLVAVIEEEYDAPTAVVESDVLDLVRQLLERKLIAEFRVSSAI